MKKLNFKKIAMMGLTTMVAASAMSVGVFAADLSTNDRCNATAEIVRAAANASDSYYAYMDYDSADLYTKELILQARKNIVFGDYAWTVNGQMSVTDSNGNKTALPEFDELFPGWNLSDLTTHYETTDIPSIASNLIDCNKAWDVPAQTDAYSASFYSFEGNGKEVYTWATTLTEGHQINFGFKNTNTDEYVGYYPGCETMQAAHITAADGVGYEIRCSSKQGACEARLRASETLPTGVTEL